MALTPEYVDVTVEFSATFSVDALKRAFSSIRTVGSETELHPHGSFVEVAVFPSSNACTQGATLYSTDGTQGTLVHVDTKEVTREGSFLLPPKKFLDILNRVHGDVTLSVSGNRVFIQWGTARWSLSIPTQRSHTRIEPDSTMDYVKVSSRDLENTLRRVATALPSTSGRVSLSQIDVADGVLIACDGTRVHQLELPGLSEGFLGRWHTRFIKAMLNALRVHSDEVEVTLGSGGGYVSVDIENVSITASVLTIDYPDTSALVRSAQITNEYMTLISAEALLLALKEVHITVDPDTNMVTLYVEKQGNSWTMRVVTRDVSGNSAESSLPVSWDSNKAPLPASFNIKHLIAMASMFYTDTERVRVYFGPDTKTQKYPLYARGQRGYAVVSQMLG